MSCLVVPYEISWKSFSVIVAREAAHGALDAGGSNPHSADPEKFSR